MINRRTWVYSTWIWPVKADRAGRGWARYWPPAGAAELLLGLALILFALLGAIWACQCRSRALALENDGVIVEGKVLKLWITQGKGRHYHVAYEYPAGTNPEERVLQDEDELPEAEAGRLKVGGPLKVRVEPADPTNHRVRGARSARRRPARQRSPSV